MKKITVLLADNHTVVRPRLEMVVQSEDEARVVGHACANGGSPVLANPILPDIAAMDVTMPLMLRTLSNQFMYAQEDERRRISRKLHDEVEQTLNAVHSHLAVLKDATGVLGKRFKRNIAEAQDLLRQTIETVHRFSRDLRPAMLDDLGLIPALRSYAHAFAEQTGVAVDFSACVGVEKLGAEQKIIFYRAAQEGLSNVARYAEASQVEISIRQFKQSFRMDIKDNGQGFRTDQPVHANGRKRLGLLGLQERIRLVNGEFSVESEPGKGTTLRIHLPVKPLHLNTYEKNYSSTG